ncbi:hypothetical protein SBRCBS47491_007423 [Sporothrix bragantina]|uniref:Ribosomal protein s17 n=1 Tax=Sporothrix bragantina TaxID=671064 RepID=A0ABP0CD36_9PEZI
MLFKSALVALGSVAALTEARTIKRTPAKNNANTNANTGGSSTCLSANALQTGSFVTGQVNDVPAEGQSNSQTDTANFINFCSGSTLTNGLQVKTGSCNGIVMGKIPATTNMVSTVITNPKLNDNLDENTTFNVTLTVANLNLGVFTNATSTYYSAPQDVDTDGSIIGHTHVTIQDVGSSFQFTTPLDATQFVFFKGINDAGNGQGTVTTAVTGGLPAGNYRVCSLSSSANHQPVLMPVAQRGGQDDCRYFTVGGSGASTTNNAGTTTNNAGTGTTGNTGSTTTGSGSTTTSSTSSSGSSGKKKKSKSCSGSKSSSASANAATAVANNASSGSTSDIAGIAAPAVTDSGNADRPFEVNGDTFVNKSAAIQRACSIQNNACANAVNSGQAAGFTVGDCNTQEETCNAQS